MYFEAKQLVALSGYQVMFRICVLCSDGYMHMQVVGSLHQDKPLVFQISSRVDKLELPVTEDDIAFGSFQSFKTDQNFRNWTLDRIICGRSYR